MRKQLRLGIMGGTFDPIHYGHLVAAEEALVQFNLDEVVFMPTGVACPQDAPHRHSSRASLPDDGDRHGEQSGLRGQPARDRPRRTSRTRSTPCWPCETSMALRRNCSSSPARTRSGHPHVEGLRASCGCLHVHRGHQAGLRSGALLGRGCAASSDRVHGGAGTGDLIDRHPPSPFGAAPRALPAPRGRSGLHRQERPLFGRVVA